MAEIKDRLKKAAGVVAEGGKVAAEKAKVAGKAKMI